MKIRLIAVLYTILILICGVFLWNKIESGKSYSIDMLDLNTKRDEIEEKIHSGEAISSLESEYGCEIVLVTDDAYESENNYFIKEGMLDSFDMVNLVSELDATYGISIAQADAPSGGGD